MKVIIHTDGGSLGNPGPSAVGVVIEAGDTKKTYAETLGVGTNNEAEYKALILALKKTKTIIGKKEAKKSDLVCFSDSELMVSQLNHRYQLKNERIIKLFVEIWNLALDYQSVSFNYIPREKNEEADGLVKSAFGRNKQGSLI